MDRLIHISGASYWVRFVSEPHVWIHDISVAVAAGIMTSVITGVAAGAAAAVAAFLVERMVLRQIRKG